MGSEFFLLGLSFQFLPQITKARSMKLVTFGMGDNGQLGDGEKYTKVKPALIPFNNVSMISCGKFHTGILTTDGHLYTFGYGGFGQLGHGYENKNDHLTPTLLSFPNAIISVSCGSFHTGIIAQDFMLYIFGDPISGGSSLSSVIWDPKRIGSGTFSVSCGGKHTAFIGTDGQLYTFGSGRNGQLGYGGIRDQIDPILVQNFPEEPFLISCGGNHTAVVTTTGNLYTFGDNKFGQLGHGDRNNRLLPTRIEDISEVSSVSCGIHHTAIIAGDRMVYTFGRGGEGQLGHDVSEDQLEPIPLWNSFTSATTVSCGGFHTAIVDSDQQIHLFGRGLEGQLGYGGKSNIYSPISLPYFSGKVTAISCGGYHTVISKEGKKPEIWKMLMPRK
jgi:alpha-tubulin suppressor-like RCC1 family protein